MHPCEAVKESADTAKAGRSRRVAVVGSGETRKARAFRMSAQLPVLKRHLECRLDGSGTVVREEDAGEGSSRQKSCEKFGQFDGLRMRRSQKRGVIECGNLS